MYEYLGGLRHHFLGFPVQIVVCGQPPLPPGYPPSEYLKPPGICGGFPSAGVPGGLFQGALPQSKPDQDKGQFRNDIWSQFHRFGTR
ncbi:hypothetical protein Avbf_02816 [Armadillidium vulgare]|nr:hypothetical protein Avbf_02816 [Armadillidium vulgare]